MAGVEGFEPSQAVLETDVLPLTLYPYTQLILYYIQDTQIMQVIFENFFIFSYQFSFFERLRNP